MNQRKGLNLQDMKMTDNQSEIDMFYNLKLLRGDNKLIAKQTVEY